MQSIKIENEQAKLAKLQRLKALTSKLNFENTSACDDQVRALDIELKSIREKQEKLKEYVMANTAEDPVYLKVGGSNFMIDRSLLTGVKDSLLCEFFSGNSSKM